MISDFLTSCCDYCKQAFSKGSRTARLNGEALCPAIDCDTTDCPNKTPCTLNDVATGSVWRVCHLTCRGAIRQRLLDIGFMPGTQVTMVRSAPLNDPIEVRIGNGFIALRRSEATSVCVVEN